MGRGGSRYGAGRPGWRRKCEHSLPLDIRALHRRGRLVPGTSFSWSWTRDGEPYGNISLASRENSVQLWYMWTPSGREPQRMVYDVCIERTPCQYGGSRPWFRCPWCKRRCALLYGVSGDGYFGCRLCLRLAYASEAESPIDRCWRQQRKIEGKLTEEGDRPKRMHRRTFERLCQRWEAIEERKDELWLPGFFAACSAVGKEVAVSACHWGLLCRHAVWKPWERDGTTFLP
jgi:hypothetical protein